MFGYLTNRKAAVMFQGNKSEIKDMQLGTLQWGSIGPMLFDVLIKALLKPLLESLRSTTVSYAEDILAQKNLF